MNNPIAFAVQAIKNNIPPQILSRFMIPKQYERLRRDPFLQTNVDNEIIEKVINGRVRMDVDTAGCTEATIPLGDLTPEQVDVDKYLYHIPKTKTNGRVITSALALIYTGVANSFTRNEGGYGEIGPGGLMGVFTPYQGYGCPAQQANGLSTAMMFSNNMQKVQTSNVRVIDGHTILVEEMMLPQSMPSLRCILSSDATFSSLARPAWKHFGDLCVLACKAHLYNQYIIDVDEGELVAGQQLGRFKEILESYSDAAEEYNTFYYEKWRKIQFMADEPRYTKYLKAQLGRGF